MFMFYTWLCWTCIATCWYQLKQRSFTVDLVLEPAVQNCLSMLQTQLFIQINNLCTAVSVCSFQVVMSTYGKSVITKFTNRSKFHVYLDAVSTIVLQIYKTKYILLRKHQCDYAELIFLCLKQCSQSNCMFSSPTPHFRVKIRWLFSIPCYSQELQPIIRWQILEM